MYKIPFDWAEFLEYAKSRRSSELAGSSFSDDEYSAANDVSPIHISGEMLKAVYTDYSQMYAPMPTPSQYLFNYQSATGTKQTGGYYEFTPIAPLWRSGLGFGADVGSKGGWKKDCYVLPYIYDDDFGSTYYYSGYWHFTVTVDEFYKATYTINYVSLLGDDTSEYTLSKTHTSQAYGFKVSYTAWVLAFDSDTAYLQGDNGAHMTTVSAPIPKTTYAVSGNLSDLVKNNFGNMLRASTFTPATNKTDDWGYIMSETPFELFKDQTSIDFSRIPNNYTITINGDTIYDYSITNPDTGDSTTIKKYIDDDYDFPDVPDLPDVPDPGDDSGTGGKVEVSGKIDVSGKVDVDVNVNVNSGSNSPDIPLPTLEGLDEGEQGIGDLIDYYQDSADQIGGFFSSFMSIVPEPIRNMIPLSIGLIIFLGLVHALRR